MSCTKRIFTWKKCILYAGILWLFFLMYFMIPVNSIWGKPKFLVEIFACTLTAESKDGTKKALNPMAGMLNLKDKSFFAGIKNLIYVICQIAMRIKFGKSSKS